jgi:hypothetical protein
MPDTILLLGVTLCCVVEDRTLSKKNIQGGVMAEVSARVNVIGTQFIAAGGNVLGGDQITFSDGQIGKISSVDSASPVFTLQIGPRLQGAAGPQGGQW